MTPTALVLLSVALGVIAGAALVAAITIARASGRKRAEAMRPELPVIATSILDAIDTFAVILDASLTPVYANSIARVERFVNANQLQSQYFLKQARSVLTTGVPYTKEPDPNDPHDTVRISVVRVETRFLVVLAEDLGEQQRVNAMRRDFIANVSHELKTPIAAISLLSEAVHEAANEPELVKNFSQSLIKESRRLGELSRDIIQLSEAQSTLRPEDREEVHLVALVEQQVDAIREYAVQNNVEITMTDVTRGSAKAAEDPVIYGRPTALASALSNLLSNAVRYSPEGGHVGVGMYVDRDSFQVSVTDQGEGISNEHQTRIFERFYRVDNSRTRRGEDGGTGLGLSIARHSMRAHGGDVSVWSQPGVGSTFTLTFPVHKGRAKDKQAKRLKLAKRIVKGESA